MEMRLAFFQMRLTYSEKQVTLRAAFGKMQGAFLDIPYRIAAKVRENWAMEVRIWAVETCILLLAETHKNVKILFFAQKQLLLLHNYAISAFICNSWKWQNDISDELLATSD